MVTNLWKKRLYPLFLVYLALIVTVSFSFSIRDKICLSEPTPDRSDTEIFFSSVYYFDSVDWLTENTNTMRRANEYSSCQMRNGLLRAFGLTGILAAITLSGYSCSVLKDEKATIQKNNTPLKLRI